MKKTKKIGIITLTRQNSLAYSALKKIVVDLGDEPICGELIGAECIFFPLEEISLVGYDFLADFFQKAGLADADVILISAPYTVNLFMLPKVIYCLRSLNSAPIILGGNEPSNNYRNLMHYRFSAFVNEVVDIAPDFIVRGAAENVLPGLLPLLEKTSMTKSWDNGYLQKILDISNIVFWLPERKALVATEFSSENLPETDIFSYVKYGEKSMAITLQRACAWAKKSKGGCLFCAIASQFGQYFHCAVDGDFFIEELRIFLESNPQIQNIDIWDDTFNISEEWAIKICGYLKTLNREISRNIRYSCFLRPKGLSPRLVLGMKEANIRTAFMGADALTEELSKRLRRGCTISEMNRSIEVLAESNVLPSLSVQLFSPESTVDDVGITSTVALGGIKNGKSTVHVHLYTFPLYGSDIYKLLKARKNLKKIPSPLLRKDKAAGFEPYRIAFDYTNYDPDVENIKQKTFELLQIETSFYVRTYPGGTVDGHKLKKILKEVRRRCLDVKKHQSIKSFWYLVIFLLEGKNSGMSRKQLIDLMSRSESELHVKEHLRKTYGNFGYRYTLSRSFDDVIQILIQKNWVQQLKDQNYRLTSIGMGELKSQLKKGNTNHYDVAAYGRVTKTDLLARFENGLN
ncbi:MAG: hypothetical protein PVG70_08450 [Desulfobacterales bacterium]|jgi:radical SAM superfamily enzyme YgiQ (UPF0313 family)